jgi:hypothetical protein
MAMEPVGHIAGIAAAVTGFISTGRSYQHFHFLLLLAFHYMYYQSDYLFI